MNSNRNPVVSLSPEVKPRTISPGRYEEISPEVELQAQKLVQLVGSPTLARHVINIVEQGGCDLPNEDATLSSPTEVKRTDPFLRALDDLETSLETPVMAGELIGWVTTVKHMSEAVGSLLRNDVPRKHSALFAMIARQDAELSNRVQTLKAKDEQLAMVDFGSVECRLAELLGHAESAAEDERKVAQARDDIVRQALAFVIRARTQETEIAAWFSEAFNRDSGSGD